MVSGTVAFDAQTKLARAFRMLQCKIDPKAAASDLWYRLQTSANQCIGDFCFEW
ncbi:MAG: hypothetical protein ACI8P0_004952 [Planctomycetaceae bacterium]|jgi:hypothetical protein